MTSACLLQKPTRQHRFRLAVSGEMDLSTQPSIQSPDELILSQLKPGSHVLFCGDPELDFSGKLIRLGHSVSQILNQNRELLLITLPLETLDLVWWKNANRQYTLEDAHRVINLLFKGLKPKTGKLVLIFLNQQDPQFQEFKIWKPLALQSLLRQSGFIFESSFENASFSLYVCKRI